MKKIMMIVAFSMLTGCANLPVHVSQELKSFYDGFEGGISTNWATDAYREECIQVVTNPVRSGTNAVKFTIYPADPSVNGGKRVELAYNNLDPYLAEVWYGWSFMLDTNYTDSGSWQIMGQWHDQPDYLLGETWSVFPGNSPPVSVQYTNGTIYLTLIYQTDDDNILRPSRHVEKGVWHDLVVHFKWSVGKDGYAEAWLDGTPLVHTNTTTQRVYAPTCFNMAGNYLKIGLYRGTNASATNTLYYDEVRIGSSYEEVVPR